MSGVEGWWVLTFMVGGWDLFRSYWCEIAGDLDGKVGLLSAAGEKCAKR